MMPFPAVSLSSSDQQTQQQQQHQAAAAAAAAIQLQLEMYRACFALNNMGVRLLELGRYRHAIKTFNEAVSALQLQQHQQQQQQLDDNQTSIIIRSALQSKLQKASMRVARCEQEAANDTTTTTTNRSSSSNTKYSVLVDVCTMDDDDENGDFDAMARHAQQYGPSTSMVFPIRFRSTLTLNQLLEDHEQQQQQQPQIHWQIAAVLYNYAMAHVLCYQERNNNNNSGGSKSSRSSGKKHLAEAARLLRFTANDMLVAAKTIMLDGCAMEMYQQQQQHHRGMLLKSLVLSLLATVFLHQNKTAQVRQIHQSLARLEQRTLEQQEKQQQEQLCDAGNPILMMMMVMILDRQSSPPSAARAA